MKIMTQVLKKVKEASSKDARVGWAHAKLKELQDAEFVNESNFGPTGLLKVKKDIENAKVSVNMDRSDLAEKKELRLGWLAIDDILHEGGSKLDRPVGMQETSYLSYAVMTIAMVGTVAYAVKRYRLA